MLLSWSQVLQQGWSEELPVGNPLATFYPQSEGYPAWTDRIHWDRVLDMSAYPHGDTAFERFEHAAAHLEKLGGGVLYYPAGVYDFSEGPFDGPDGRGLLLPKGVVIRGETPSGDWDAGDGFLHLPTQFVFGSKVKRERITLVLHDAVQYPERKDATDRFDLHVTLRIEGEGPHGDAFVSIPEMEKETYFPGQVTQTEDGWTLDLNWKSIRPVRRRQPLQARFSVQMALDDQDQWTAAWKRTQGDLGQGVPTQGEVSVQEAAPHVVPRYWNLIGLKPGENRGISQTDEVGIVWVHLKRAVIYFGPEMTWHDTWGETVREIRDPNVWSMRVLHRKMRRDPELKWNRAFLKPEWQGRVPDGTHPWDPMTGSVTGDEHYVGSGNGRLVFGCVMEDAAVLNESHDLGSGPDMFAPMKFGSRIAVYGSRVFVANNLLPKSDANFRYTQKVFSTRKLNRLDENAEPFPVTLLWDYGDVCGIDVNKDMVGNRHRPGLYEEGVIVKDNWVYSHGQKGINVSGTWVTVSGNRNEREFLQEGGDPYGLGGGWHLSIDGAVESSPGGAGEISDNYSRAFDLAGRNLWVANNWCNNNGSNPGNDGETILCQRYRGTIWESWSLTRNTHIRGRGDHGYMGGWNIPFRGGLIAWNTTPGDIGSLMHRHMYDMGIVHDQPDRIRPNDREIRKREEFPVEWVQSSGGRLPKTPRNVQAKIHEQDAVEITWEDVADNEVAYRVERKIGSTPWRTIAYRPPQLSGHEKNPPAWIDFAAPPHVPLVYRVVAVDERDQHDGNAIPTPPVQITLKESSP